MGHFRRRLTRVGHTLWDIPQWTPMQRVRLTLPLVAFVGGMWLLGAVVVTLMPWRHNNWAAAAIGALLVGGMAAYEIPLFGRVPGRYSASGFFHLAFSFAIGPPAILALSFGDPLGSAVRRRPGTFRTTFNIANHFLANTAAWLTFIHVANAHSPAIVLAAGGVAGAAAETIVNRVLLAAVVSLAGESSEFRAWLLSLAQQGSLALLFGVTAAGATYLYGHEGTFGIVTLILPLALVQAYMVALARRTYEHDQAQEKQAQEQKELLRREADALAREARAQRLAAGALRRAATASETERLRLASDLHDGAIQDIYGLYIVASGLSQRMKGGDATAWTPSDVRRFVEFTQKVSSDTAQELRALMVELAPPLLDQEGLSAALRQLLARLLGKEHVTWSLDCTEAPIDLRQGRMVHQVVLESVRNVVKHSHARHVAVAVRIQNQRLVASVRDDGTGFTAEERAERRKRGHNGLGMLEQRTRDEGGRLIVDSAPGRGTTITLTVPLLLVAGEAEAAGEAPDDGAALMAAEAGLPAGSEDGAAGSSVLMAPAQAPAPAPEPAAVPRAVLPRRRRSRRLTDHAERGTAVAAAGPETAATTL